MGWCEVASSADVPEGGVFAVDVDGAELVLWRSASGSLVACDARCPHQWSHLAEVGAVDGEELVCLSHFWRFDAHGFGTKQAMNGRRDEKCPTTVHEVREADGRIEVAVTTR